MRPKIAPLAPSANSGNFTFVVVTDREDLDGQIYRNFLHTGVVAPKDEVRILDMTYQSLKGARNAGTHGILAGSAITCASAPGAIHADVSVWPGSAISGFPLLQGRNRRWCPRH